MIFLILLVFNGRMFQVKFRESFLEILFYDRYPLFCEIMVGIRSETRSVKDVKD